MHGSGVGWIITRQSVTMTTSHVPSGLGLKVHDLGKQRNRPCPEDLDFTASDEKLPSPAHHCRGKGHEAILRLTRLDLPPMHTHFVSE